MAMRDHRRYLGALGRSTGSTKLTAGELRPGDNAPYPSPSLESFDLGIASASSCKFKVLGMAVAPMPVSSFV